MSSLVVIELAGEPAAVAAVENILRERLATPGLDASFSTIDAVDPAAVVAPSAAQDGELARVWLDLRAEGRITLYLVDGKRERVLVRHFARYDNPEVAREELGHVVELALVALKAGERIGIGREAAQADLAPAAPTPAPPPPPPKAEAPAPPPPQPRAATHLRAGAFYEAQVYAGGPELWSGPGAVVDLRHRPAPSKLGYGALVSGQYRLPSSAGGAGASMRFDSGAVHALAVGTLAISTPAELAVGIGGGLDFLNAEARGERTSHLGEARVRFAEGSLRVLPTLRALVRYEHAVPSLRLFAGVGIDVPVESARYLLARPGESVVLFEAWSVRPFLLVGIETP